MLQHLVMKRLFVYRVGSSPFVTLVMSCMIMACVIVACVIVTVVVPLRGYVVMVAQVGPLFVEVTLKHEGDRQKEDKHVPVPQQQPLLRPGNKSTAVLYNSQV